MTLYWPLASGTLTEDELRLMLSNCVEESSIQLDDETLSSLTSALFQQTDADNSGDITFEELLAQLEKHPGILDNLTIRYLRNTRVF